MDDVSGNIASTASPDPGPEAAILMCTYNGAAFLREQLDSIRAQTFRNWRLWVSDDGSTDGTPAVIEKWAEEAGPGRVRILSGPGRGFCRNFMSLTANKDIRADVYFWADQDDIWLPEKMERAAAMIKSAGPEAPVLYGGRTILVDAGNKEYGLSPLFNRRPPSLENALLQSLAGGNTMAFNQKARELILLGLESALVTHDWWAYLVVSGCGGRVIYDERPMVRYRQHGQNQIGSNLGLRAKLKRLGGLVNNRFKLWTVQNLEALEDARPRLTPANKALLDNFIELRRSGNIFDRWRLLKKTGVYRQLFLQSLVLKTALLAGKV